MKNHFGQKNLMLLTVLAALSTQIPKTAAADGPKMKMLECKISAVLVEGHEATQTMAQPIAANDGELSARLQTHAYRGRLLISASANQGSPSSLYPNDFIFLTIKDTVSGVEVMSLPRGPQDETFVTLDSASLGYTFQDESASGANISCSLK